MIKSPLVPPVSVIVTAVVLLFCRCFPSCYTFRIVCLWCQKDPTQRIGLKLFGEENREMQRAVFNGKEPPHFSNGKNEDFFHRSKDTTSCITYPSKIYDFWYLIFKNDGILAASDQRKNWDGRLHVWFCPTRVVSVIAALWTFHEVVCGLCCQER